MSTSKQDELDMSVSVNDDSDSDETEEESEEEAGPSVNRSRDKQELFRTVGGKKTRKVRFASQSALVESKQRSRRETAAETDYGRSIYAVFRTVFPKAGPGTLSISTEAMGILNSFMNQVFEKVGLEAARLAKMSKRKTMGVREVRTATQLILSGELRRHALVEGDKALQTYLLTTEQDPNRQ